MAYRNHKFKKRNRSYRTRLGIRARRASPRGFNDRTNDTQGRGI